MSYINKIDLLIYNSINEIYNDIKDEKFKKLDSFGKEPEYEKIIHKYIKNNKSKNELKDVLKDKTQIQQISNIIDKYIIIYCLLFFGIELSKLKNVENAEDVFVKNIIKMSTTVKELTSEINSNIIESFKFYNNLLLVIDKSITSDTSDELKSVVEFKNSIGGESLTQNFSNSNKDRSHNAILLIIFKQIYLKNDKNDILKIFEKNSIKKSEYKYITIIDSKFEFIDYSTIESLVNIKDDTGGVTKGLYNLLLDYDNLDLYYIGADKKINELLNKQILVPITDEFLRYHKDSEKYEKIEVEDTKNFKASSKKDETKLKYIITKINSLTDYYSPKTSKDSKDIEKIFYQPMMNRKVVLYNDTEEISIINKFINIGKINLENNELFSDLREYRSYPYENFKNFKDIGFQLKASQNVDALRYSNIEFLDNKNIVGSLNRPLEFRSLCRGMIVNVVGVALPVSLFNNDEKIRCLSLKNLTNIREYYENGFEGTIDLLRDGILDTLNKDELIYWIFDMEKDKLISDKYSNVNQTNYESYLKTLLDNIYNKVSVMTYELLTNIINESNENLFYLKKIIQSIQEKFLYLNIREEYYAKIQKLLYYIKLPQVKEEYDKNEDFIPGINSPLIKIPTIVKSKEKEILVEVNEEEKISLEDELLQNATCQHTITFNKIMMYRNKDPSAFSQALYEFIKKYRQVNVEGEFLCKSCSQLLDIKKFVTDTFQGSAITLNLSFMQPLEELSKYEKFSKSIKQIDKIIERVAYVMNMNTYVGNVPVVRIKRQEVTKVTIDLIETTSELLKTNDPLIRKERLQKAESLYGISKQFTNYFLFKLDNEIFVYTSQETDKFKKYKYNNILSYIILLMILDITNNQIFFLNFDKNYNYVLFNKYGFSLFNNLKIRINDSNDIDDIKKYKMLCYLIYYIAGMMIKFNIWYFDIQTKEDKGFPRIGLDIIINTVIHLLNTITETYTNNKNNYLFDTISTRFFIKLNTQLNDKDSKEILDKIELMMSDRIDITNNKIRIRAGTQHLTNILDGIIQSVIMKHPNYVLLTYLQSYQEPHKLAMMTPDELKEFKKMYENLQKKNILTKFNEDGSKRTLVLKDEELNKFTDKDYDKLVELLRKRRNESLVKFIKLEQIRKEKNNKKITKETKFVDKMRSNYKKYYDNTYDTLITAFINKCENIIGPNININNANIYLKENTYIIDHNHLGQNAEIKVIKDGRFKPVHEYFKQDVIILERDNIDIFYNVIENNLLGYKEKNKNYVDVRGTGKFVKVNYSVENKLKYLGFDGKYIRVKDYQKDDIYSKEKNSMKDMVDEMMRNRINALKRFMEFSQKILYQIKNKFKVQLVEKGLTDFEKIKQKYFIKEKIDKSKLELSGDAEIVLNFQSKFKYINTTKENNKKILVNWKLLNDSAQHDIKKTYITKDKYIDASYLISLGDNDHLIMFYTLSEISYLIDLNDDSYTKSNLVFLFANIIDYCYKFFNKQLDHVEFRKFKYMIDSEAEVISYDQSGTLQFNQTEEDIKKEKELNEEDKEREDALDLDQDEKNEEFDDPDTDDEFTKMEVRGDQ